MAPTQHEKIPQTITPELVELASLMTQFQQLYQEVEELIRGTEVSDPSNEYPARFSTINHEWLWHQTNSRAWSTEAKRQSFISLIAKLQMLKGLFRDLKPLKGLDVQYQVDLLVVKKDYEQELILEMFSERVDVLLFRLKATNNRSDQKIANIIAGHEKIKNQILSGMLSHEPIRNKIMMMEMLVDEIHESLKRLRL